MKSQYNFHNFVAPEISKCIGMDTKDKKTDNIPGVDNISYLENINF